MRTPCRVPREAVSQSLFKIYQNAIPAHLFPLGRVDLTLFGWLYLQGRTDRLNELFEAMMEEASNAI